jgi:hypothetical protein
MMENFVGQLCDSDHSHRSTVVVVGGQSAWWLCGVMIALHVQCDERVCDFRPFPLVKTGRVVHLGNALSARYSRSLLSLLFGLPCRTMRMS